MLLFNEGTIIRASVQLSSSSDTSGIDDLRQGVEIRTLKHAFSTGQPKLWSGDISHEISVEAIGQDKTFGTLSLFVDVSKFNAKEFLEQRSLIYPITFDEISFEDGKTENGIIEPLVIRACASRLSIESPYVAHSVKGELLDGNYDFYLKTNRVTDIVDTKEQSSGELSFIDGVQVFGTVTTASVLLNGYTNTNVSYVRKYDDTKSISFVSSSTSSSIQHYSPKVLNNRIITSDGNVDNGIIDGDSKFTSMGHLYTIDSYNTCGTDSIAFINLGAR